MSPVVIASLRTLLLGIAAGAVAGQIAILVAMALEIGAGLSGLTVFYAVLGVAALAALEVGLVALWTLLTMVRRGAIFDGGSAFRWVHVVTVAGLLAALLVATACVHYGEIDDAPGLIVIGGGVAVGGAAYALLMIVMRGLLQNATVLRRELDEVV